MKIKKTVSLILLLAIVFCVCAGFAVNASGEYRLLSANAGGARSVAFATEDEPAEDLFLYVDINIVFDIENKYYAHHITTQASGGVPPYQYRFNFPGEYDSGYRETSDLYRRFLSNGKYPVSISVMDSVGTVNTADTYILVDVVDDSTLPPVTEPKETFTLYFENKDSWSNVYAYVWNDKGEQALGLWPGTRCTVLSDDICSIDVPDGFDYIIFNNGSKKTTNELVNPGGFNVAMWESADGDKFEYFWYHPIITHPTEATENTEPEVTTEATVSSESFPVTEATDPTEAPATGATDSSEPETTSAPIVTEATEAETTVALEKITASVPETTVCIETSTVSVTEAETTLPEEETTLPTESDTEPVPEFEQGDVNCDGKLNIKDVTTIQKFLAKILPFDEKIMLLADFNNDGIVNIKDATTIQKKLANLI